MAYFNDFILPETNHTLKNLMIKVTYRKPINAIKPGTFTVLNNISIYAREAVGNELRGLIIYNRENTSFPQTITAEKGTIKILNNGNQVKVELYKGEMHERDAKEPNKYQLRTFKKYTMTRSDLGFEMDNSPTNYRSDREMTSKQIKGALNDKIKDISLAEQDVSRIRKQLESLPKDKSDPFVMDEYKKYNHMLKLKIAEIDDMRSQLMTYQVEVQKKYSLAFACFVFFIVGAPIGMMTKTSGIGTAFSVSALIFLTFYVMIVGGEELADRAILTPQMAMWLPNVIFLILGILLTYSSYREKHLIDLSHITAKIQNIGKKFF
jgi:lipopolysaccharide export system permease protein